LEVGITGHILRRGPSKNHSTKVALFLNYILKKVTCDIYYLWILNLRHWIIFSSPDPNQRVRWAIVTTERPSSVGPLTFHILINSSEATGPIWTKLWWNVICIIGINRLKEKFHRKMRNIC
jgi:hypothetical protein